MKFRARYWFFCVKIILIGQCVCLFFCAVIGCLLLSFIVLSYSLPRCAVLIFLFACFYGSRFCSPAINSRSALIDLSQSDIQILHALRIDNGIPQCACSSWTWIFKNKFVVHGQYIWFVTPLLISVFKNDSTAM